MARARGPGATLKDIAQATGVSLMTVQRAVSGHRLVAVATRQLVLDAAERLGYRPNAFARAIRRGSFDSIGLLTSSDLGRSNLTLPLLDGIEDVLAARGKYLLHARMTDPQLLDEQLMPRLLGQTMIDGLLIKYDNRIPARMPELIERYRIPAIWINVKLAHDCVRPDDLALGEAGTKHLIDLGHRRIGYVDFSYDVDNPDEHYSSFDRFEGYRRAMDAAGLAVRSVRGRRLEPEARRQAAHGLLAGRDGATAAVCYGNNGAWVVRQTALALGRTLPGECSLLTLDGSFPAYLEIPLTGGRIDQRTMGRTATELLLEKLRRPERRLDPVLLPVTIVDEGSTGAAR